MTYQFDDKLPKLPVPKLENTFARLRKSVEAVGSTEAELAEFDAAVAEAIPQLQDAQAVLLKRKEDLPNYISDWWEDYAYLRNRFPNVLNTNVYSIRNSDFDAEGKPAPLVADQFKRAALLGVEAVAWRDLMAKEQLPVDKLKDTPMCMNQYRNYFTVRVPHKECDEIVAVKPVDCKMIHMMYKGAMFFITVTRPDGTNLNFAEIYACVQYGIEQLEKRGNGFPRDECVCALSGMERTAWAEAWEEISQQSEKNKRYLDQMVQSMLTICLDDTPVNGLNGIPDSQRDPHNRWFDRSIIRTVASNGVVFEHGDHTAMDAIVMASVPLEFMIAQGQKFVKSGQMDAAVVGECFDPATAVELISWDLTPKLKSNILKAIDDHNALEKHHEGDVFIHKSFGRDGLKNYKINPDAFLQLSLQLAAFRDRGRFFPVYETASTRAFQKGRTDVIRSLTTELKQFISVFDDASISIEQKGLLLKQAMDKHVDMVRTASKGEGIDRHLFCLRIAQNSLSKPIPKVFDLPKVQESGSFQLITSQMLGNNFIGGFPQMPTDGYAACYYIRSSHLAVVVSTNKSGGATDLQRFQTNLRKALEDLAQLAKAAEEAMGTPASPMSP